jgi:hypothetical protein
MSEPVVEPRYRFERRPKFLDDWVNRRIVRNRLIERAPIMLLTGAGASIPAGLLGLELPETMTLESGVTFATADLMPPGGAASADDRLDLETLLIVTDVLRALPRQVVHEGLGNQERSRAVLGFTVQLMLPRLAGGSVLSSDFVYRVIDRLLELDRHTEGKLLDGLSSAIERRIIDSCLTLPRETLVGLYGPLFRRLVSVLEAVGAPLVLPVFTTNYDETFDFLRDDLREELSAEVGREVVFFDGTQPSPGHAGWRTFDPREYSRLRSPSDTTVSVVVFYLHGSIRWFGSSEPKPWFEIYAASASIARSRPEPRLLLQPNALKVMWGESHADLLGAMVPEQRDPFRPGGEYYALRLAYLFFERCLENARVLLAIGYSFRDSDARELLLNAWEGYGRPRLVLLDPRPQPIVTRLGPAPLVTQLPRRFDAAAASEVVAALQSALAGYGAR